MRKKTDACLVQVSYNRELMKLRLLLLSNSVENMKLSLQT